MLRALWDSGGIVAIVFFSAVWLVKKTMDYMEDQFREREKDRK